MPLWTPISPGESKGAQSEPLLSPGKPQTGPQLV